MKSNQPKESLQKRSHLSFIVAVFIGLAVGAVLFGYSSRAAAGLHGNFRPFAWFFPLPLLIERFIETGFTNLGPGVHLTYMALLIVLFSQYPVYAVFARDALQGKHPRKLILAIIAHALAVVVASHLH